jgi:protein-S-isoprenylcysteine O-methyltransferase Ste14
MAQDATLVVVSALFFWIHLRLVLGGSLTSAFFAVEQGLLVFMFLTRRRSEVTSTRVADWVAATLGGWLPLVMQPQADVAGGLAGAGMALQLAGLSCTAVGFLYLGKSFGIVAANRGLKVGGPYRLVRHPIYFSHTITLTGFLVANFHPLNAALLTVIMTCQVFRMAAEERVLTGSASYADYKAKVRWRLVPGLY